MPPYISGVIDPNIIITPGHGVNICTSPTASGHKIKNIIQLVTLTNLTCNRSFINEYNTFTQSVFYTCIFSTNKKRISARNTINIFRN